MDKEIEIDEQGRRLFIIEDIKVWAYSYLEALEIFSFIKQSER